jgi:uncharacterized protein
MAAQDVEFDPIALSRLERFLVPQAVADGPARLSRLDGFLTAVAAGPQRDEPIDWLAAALDYADEGPEQDDEIRSFVALVLGRYVHVGALLDEESPRCAPIPSGSEDGKPTLRDWSLGFLDRVRAVVDDWAPLFEDERNCVLMVPIAAAAAEEHDAPEFDLSVEAFRRLRADAGRYIPDCVVGISEFWRALAPYSNDAPVRRSSPKIGRNAPCPCGSGRKFKRCCGA